MIDAQARAAPLSAAEFDGPVRVIAGPGSGKTHLLVELYLDLVRSGRAGRAEILALTFSTTAAAEIAERVDAQLGDSYRESWISTFHSFCARLLRDHRPDPHRLLMNGFQEWLAMRATLARLAERRPADMGALAPLAGADSFALDAAAFVSMLKQNQVHPARLALLAEAGGTPRLRALASVYSAYQATCDAAGLRDFRDLVIDAIGLLEARPALLESLRGRFRFILVDEFQDVDPAQFQLLRLLAPPSARPAVLVAGDPGQSIYGFRGTVPRLLSEEFERAYGGRSLSLGGSRRCAPGIVTAASRLLRPQGPTPASGAGVPGPAATGGVGGPGEGAVEIVRGADAAREAEAVAREIRRLMIEHGWPPGAFAVLLRSTATLAAPFEDALRALDLPYEVRGLGGLARNETVRFLLVYLGALARPDGAEALADVLASGLGGVSQRAASRLRRHAVEEGRPFQRVVHRLLYWLEATDAAAYPLPWPAAAHAGDETAGEAPAPVPPAYAAYMTAGELASIHRAVTAFHRLAAEARRLPVRALAFRILLEAGVLARVLESAQPEAERRERLAELRAALDALEQLEEVWTRLHGSPPRLGDVADRLEAMMARAVDESTPAPAHRNAVQVMTVHQAKGLGFDVVFLSGFAVGMFPTPVRPHPVLDADDQTWLQANLEGFSPAWPAGAEEHLAEEARLAYVGLTRARTRVYITFADEYAAAAGPSPFLERTVPGASTVPPTELTAVAGAGSILTRGEAEAALAGLPLEGPDRDRLAALGVDLAFVTDPTAGHPFVPYGARPDPVAVGHFSATALNDYLKCPRIYWYNDHPGLAAPARGPELERGSFLHEVLEEFHRREDEWRPQPPDAQRAWLTEVFEQKLERYLDHQDAVLDRRLERQEVERILENYIRFATSSQPIRRSGTLAVERRFVLDLDGAEIHGKIDRINDTGDGTCEVVDYKTGRGSSAARAYANYFGPQPADVQLLVYHLACREGRDEEGRPLALEPRFLSLWYPKEVVYGQMRQVLFTTGDPVPGLREWMQRAVSAEDLERGRRLIAGAIRRIREGDFAPAPLDSVGTCLSWFGCPHAAICPFGGSPQE